MVKNIASSTSVLNVFARERGKNLLILTLLTCADERAALIRRRISLSFYSTIDSHLLACIAKVWSSTTRFCGIGWLTRSRNNFRRGTCTQKCCGYLLQRNSVLKYPRSHWINCSSRLASFVCEAGARGLGSAHIFGRTHRRFNILMPELTVYGHRLIRS